MKTKHTKRWIWATMAVFCLTFASQLMAQSPTPDGVKLRFTFSGRIVEEVDVLTSSILMVDAGSFQYLIKPESMNAQGATVRVAKCSYSYNPSNRSFTLTRISRASNSIALSQPTAIGSPGDGIQMDYQGVYFFQTKVPPIGACKGICCTATCFTQTCCSDVDECRLAKCNCQAPGPCPQSSSPGGMVISVGGHNNFPPIHGFAQLYNANANQLTIPQP